MPFSNDYIKAANNNNSPKMLYEIKNRVAYKGNMTSYFKRKQSSNQESNANQNLIIKAHKIESAANASTN